jgi:hypothetical protein
MEGLRQPDSHNEWTDERGPVTWIAAWLDAFGRSNPRS